MMDRKQRDLFIRTIIGEAGNQPYDGQAGVAHVIRNRLNSGRWGGDVERVILAPKQFSLWNPGDPAGVMARNVPETSPQYSRVGQLVDGVMAGQIGDPTGGALNYYNPTAASPNWGPGMVNKVQIGAHLFGTAGGQPDTMAARAQLAAPADTADVSSGVGTTATTPVSNNPVGANPSVAMAAANALAPQDNGIGKALAALGANMAQPKQQEQTRTAELPSELFNIPQGPTAPQSYSANYMPPSMRGRLT